MPSPLLPNLSIALGKPDDQELRGAIRGAQRMLQDLGLYHGELDAHFGPKTHEAVQRFQSAHKLLVDGIIGPVTWGELYLSTQRDEEQLIYAGKVSKAFQEKVKWIAARLGVDPNYLMAVMAFESDKTFRPDIRNYAGSSGTGLIQFMDFTARGLDTTTAKLAAMTAEQQLDYVERYFKPYTGRLKTLEDTYMAVLWPRAVGKPSGYVLFKKPTLAYRQNRGLDRNGDGNITKWEAAEKVREAYREGLADAAQSTPA